jgi:endonuclease/exonuclease/phosphatase family metal-dependent hydrolase
MLRVLSWNMGHRAKAWQGLIHGDLGAGADVALLQEAPRPPRDLRLAARDVTPAANSSWKMSGHVDETTFRTAIVRLSDRIEFKPRNVVRLGEHALREVPVSRPGTLAIADVKIKATGETFSLASMYGYWDGFATPTRWKMMADTSVHRLISDLSALVGHETDHGIVAAGDLNILRGYGEEGSSYWARRYQTVFDRMEAIGMPFVGPRLPGGERPVNRPSEMPPDSDTVPTYRTRQKEPASATRQLDFAFASKAIAKRIRVRALTDEWGPSDHCRLLIEVE